VLETLRESKKAPVKDLSESGRDHLLFNHSVNEIEKKLALTAAGMGNTAAVQVGLTAHQELKFDRLTANFHRQKKRPMILVALLGFGEKIGGQLNPVEADYRSLSDGTFEVGVYIIPLHGGEFVNNNLSHIFCFLCLVYRC
jgi:hypothetical protein